MEIEVLTSEDASAEQRRPLNLEGGLVGLVGAEYDKPLETIPERVNREEIAHEAIVLPKAKPKRSARPKAVRFEGEEPLGERSSGSTPAQPKVKGRSRATARTTVEGEDQAVELVLKPEEKPPAQCAEGARLSPEAAALVNNWEQKNGREGRSEPQSGGLGRGRPPGARNKPKPPTIVERVVEKTVYEKPPPLSPQDLQALLKDTLRKQELDAREQKRAYYSQLIRRNR